MGDGGKQALDVADWWINKAATWGLSFVFLALVLLIFLWVAVTFLSILKKWLPIWFESSINTQKRVAEAVEHLIASVDCTHHQVHSIHSGLKEGMRAVTTYVRKNKTRLGITSDALSFLERAQEHLEEGSSTNHRKWKLQDEPTESNGPDSDPPAQGDVPGSRESA